MTSLAEPEGHTCSYVGSYGAVSLLRSAWLLPIACCARAGATDADRLQLTTLIYFTNVLARWIQHLNNA